jgi:hypothetical protein
LRRNKIFAKLIVLYFETDLLEQLLRIHGPKSIAAFGRLPMNAVRRIVILRVNSVCDKPQHFIHVRREGLAGKAATVGTALPGCLLLDECAQSIGEL